MRRTFALLLLFASAATAQSLSPIVKQFVSVNEPTLALSHVRVIDGTGALARENQTVIISDGKIQSVGEGAPPNAAKVLDLTGYTVIPGLVGMHDHMFYPGGGGYNELNVSAPRLYLAGGVTTIRTTGSIEPYSDLSLKRMIDAGLIPGPHMFVTGPYLEGPGAFTPQMHELTGADDARRTVAYWAEEGVHNYKAYMNITRASSRPPSTRRISAVSRSRDTCAPSGFARPPRSASTTSSTAWSWTRNSLPASSPTSVRRKSPFVTR